MADHTITLDGTFEWGDDTTSTISYGLPTAVSTTAAVTVAGTLARRTTGNSSLTLRGSMEVVLGGRYSQGSRSAPIPANHTAELLTNYATTLADNKYPVVFRAGSYCDIYGAEKKRITTLTATANAGATTIYVSDAAGWNVGDEIYLANTTTITSNAYDVRTIAAGYTPGSLTVPLSSAITYQHLIGCPTANLTSNVTVRSFSTAHRGPWVMYAGTAGSVDAFDFGYCTFDALGYTNEAVHGFSIRSTAAIYGTATYPASFKEFESVAFVSRDTNHAFSNYNVQKFSTPIPMNNCAFISRGTGSTRILMDTGYSKYVNCMTAAAQTFFPDTTSNAIGWLGSWEGGWFCSTAESGTAMTSQVARNIQIRGATFSGPSADVLVAASVDGPGPVNWTFDNCDVAGSFARDPSRFLLRYTVFATQATVTAKDCLLGSVGAVGVNQSILTDSSWVKIVNRNRDITLQEEHYRWGSINRDNAVKYRSTSSLCMTPSVAGSPFTRTFTISAGAGETVRLVGYCRYDTAYHNGGTGFVAPKLQIGGTINGVTLTPVTYTAPSANAGNWDLVDVSITNTSGAAGDLTVTLSAQCGVTNGNAYFDGIVVAPMVVLARHYGFVFDETNPKRVVNSSISASFATADAYTGITISWGSTSTTTLGASKTFQQVYDYAQAKGVQNLTSAMPFTGSGAAGNVSLTALGNFTTTGYTLNGGGSLAMGAFTLTANQPWAYTYTGGTFAQAASTPSFTGGQLNIGAAGTFTFGMSSGIVSMTPTALGTYGFGSGTFAGTLDLRNTSTHAITVQVPAGTTTTTANNTGGTITVSAPSVTQGLNFTGLVAGSQVKVFATGTTTELFTTSSSATSETWSQAGGSDTVVDYTVMKAGKLPIRVVGLTVNSAVVSTPVSQSVDRSYIASSGLAYGSTATVTPGTSRFAITVATSVQNWYSFMIESWISQAALKNAEFPISSNGPNSYTLESWEFSAGINLLKQDGLRYTIAGVPQKIWAAIYSVDTAAGLQVKYQQADGGTTVSAAATGKIDQLVQVYSIGVYDYRSFLALKIQKDGYDQAETDVVGTYGTLEDQLYVVGLNPASNGMTTGAPTVAGSPAIVDHGASPVTWNSKAFSITITDSAAGNTGANLMRWIRYNLGLGGIFQGKDGFCWHDLIQVNGSGFKTVRGSIYGDTGAALKGVRVLTNAGLAHPDFNVHTADDGTTYSPPQQVTIAISAVVAGSRVQIYDTLNGVELLNSTSVYTFTETYTVPRTLRVRIAKQSGTTARNFVEANIGSIGVGAYSLTYLASQSQDATYNTNAIDGSTVTGITIAPSPARVSISIAGGSVTWPQIYAYQVYWLATATGIADEAAFINAPDTANYLLTLFDIKNTSATPLTITGGYGRDAVTGLVKDCIDTAGSTGNIFPMPDHAIPYSSGSGMSAGQAADLAAAAAGVASITGGSAIVSADVKKMNAATVIGDGTDSNLWRGA